MKSAYELAMERLAKEDPNSAISLTEAQKKELAEIDEKFKAKFAEREIFLQQKLDEARRSGDFSAAEDLQKQISSEKARIEEERETEKDKVRNRSQ